MTLKENVSSLSDVSVHKEIAIKKMIISVKRKGNNDIHSHPYPSDVRFG